jgi:hypothetical protein
VLATSPPEATISTLILTRIIVLLIAVWSLVAGTVLVGFHGATSGALGAGVTDEAGQRLLGAHLLILVPAYLLIAWRPERHKSFLWLPLAAQLATVSAVGYSILTGETDFGDGILAAAVSGIFVVLLGFVWISEQRSVSRAKYETEARESAAESTSPAARNGAPVREP